MSINFQNSDRRNKYATMYLDQMLLPDYGELREVTQPNAAKNVTLDGQLYVDYYNVRRVWEIKWNYLSAEQYDLIRAKFDKQFANAEMLIFYVNDLNLRVPVYIEISEKNIKWNGQLVEGFKITLEERYAVS